MSNPLFSLALGSLLIVAANLALFRFSVLGATRGAIIVAVATLGIYPPLAFVFWPGGDILAMHLAVYLLCSLACGMLLGGRERSGQQGGRGWHWGPMAITGFFVVLVIVNAIFILVAQRGISPQLSTSVFPDQGQRNVSSAFPGVVSHDFHKKESLYNAYLDQVERQRQRGWRIRKGWLKKPVREEAAVFKVVARTREGEPLRGARVTGDFLRPSDVRLDMAFAMEETAPGVFKAELTMPAAGMWNLVLQIRKGEELHEIRASTSVLAR
jgi:nitrogen fixation protein FixH